MMCLSSSIAKLYTQTHTAHLYAHKHSLLKFKCPLESRQTMRDDTANVCAGREEKHILS